MVAIKDGSLEFLHIGHSDYKDFMTFLIPLGDWTEGGDICLPQLKRHFSIRPGEVFACFTG